LEDKLESKNKQFAEANKLDAEQRVTTLNSDIAKEKAKNDKLKLDITIA
jgi:cell division protein FtsL